MISYSLDSFLCEGFFLSSSSPLKFSCINAKLDFLNLLIGDVSEKRYLILYQGIDIFCRHNFVTDAVER